MTIIDYVTEEVRRHWSTRMGAQRGRLQAMTDRKIEGSSAGAEIPKCPYCGKPIEKPVQRKIISRPPSGTMTFCSQDCGAYYQMGCEE